MIEQLSRENGYPVPGTVINNADTTVVRMMAKINQAGKELSDLIDFTILTKEYTFSTASGTAEYALPSDFLRFKGRTQWDRTNTLAYAGPLTARDWQGIKSGGAVLSRPPSFRVKPSSAVNKFFIEPEPTATETHVYEYITNEWVQLASGQSEYFDFSGETVADTNTSLIDEELLKLYATYMFLESVGLPFAAAQMRAENRMDRFVGRDGDVPSLSLDGRLEPFYLHAYSNDRSFGL